MNVKAIFASILSITLSPICCASIIELSCTNSTTEISEYIVIDQENNSVISNNLNGLNVSINKNTISYDLAFKKNIPEFQVTINRTSGAMVVINLATKTIDSRYSCEPAKPKF